MGGGGKVQRVNLWGKLVVLRGGEEHTACLLVHADQTGDHPITMGQLAPVAGTAAGAGEMPQMAMPVPL